MREDERRAQSKLLIDALLSVGDEEECFRLLTDLLTIKEMQDLSQRMEVAKLLREKKTYADIALQTGVSTATISRVNRALMYGEGGYNMVLDRLEAQK